MDWKKCIEKIYSEYNILENYKKNVLRYEELLDEKAEELIQVISNNVEKSVEKHGKQTQRTLKINEILNTSTEHALKLSREKVVSEFYKIKDWSDIDQLIQYYEKIADEQYFQLISTYCGNGELNAFFNTQLKSLVQNPNTTQKTNFKIGQNIVKNIKIISYYSSIYERSKEDTTELLELIKSVDLEKLQLFLETMYSNDDIGVVNKYRKELVERIIAGEAVKHEDISQFITELKEQGIHNWKEFSIVCGICNSLLEVPSIEQEIKEELIKIVESENLVHNYRDIKVFSLNGAQNYGSSINQYCLITQKWKKDSVNQLIMEISGTKVLFFNYDGTKQERYGKILTFEVEDLAIENIIESIKELDTNFAEGNSKINYENKNTSYWVGKAPDQSKAKYMIDNGCFEIYFTETNIGDMLKYNSIEEVSDTNEWFKNEDGNLRINDRKALWDIAHEIKIGDVIYLALGMNNVVAKGTVISGYEYNTENRYHQVKVQYDETFKGTISSKFSRKTLTNITANIELQERIESDITNQLSNKEILDMSMFDNNAKQLIIDGAPGTGKSYGVEEDIDNNNIKHERVTFYQEYEYHNFVGSILPVVNDSNISYEFVKGPFTKILNDALSNPEEKHYLVIEELTRGNAASIFGDIFQLLDRDEEGFSEYPISHENILNSLDEEVQEFLKREFDGKVVLPSNLSIICTINSSDQNVFPLDTAFKRRFDYEIKSTLPSEDFIDFDIKFGELEAGSWKNFYQKLNKFILAELKLKEDKQVGPYFIKNHSNDPSKMKSIQTKLAMYMWNDLHKVHTMSTKSIFNSDKVHTLYDVDRIFREGTQKEVLDILSTEFKAHFGLNDE